MVAKALGQLFTSSGIWDGGVTQHEDQIVAWRNLKEHIECQTSSVTPPKMCRSGNMSGGVIDWYQSQERSLDIVSYAIVSFYILLDIVELTQMVSFSFADI
ncbi:hypothetical protein Tco_0989184 [Tanacetum coccineum]|uniref:Uncharacterized protein n=1 Tax=Tanacetum coccineum TaxID=301880 RepID=A0ABQ5ET12_9ASTR